MVTSGRRDAAGEAASGGGRGDFRPLTFLFTDVVGSTRLWETRPVEMAQAMELHDSILEAGFEIGGAVTVKNTGDGFMAVFDETVAAVRVAIRVQLDLAAAAWPADVRPEVRSGLHTGEATARSGDFFGPAVNRAARVAQVAHGGQIIVSGAAAAAAAQPDAQIELLDLGLHRLRDLATPERLFQVTGAGLPNEFPPLLTLDQFRHNLPVERGVFVGRESDLRRLSAVSRQRRLVTLRGVGGVGKTRLALQVAAERLDAEPDGVWLARLDTVDADGDVANAVAAAVGATATGGGTSRDALIDWGRNRSALLILDSCEHVVEGAAELAARLLEFCPSLRLMTTSRTLLGIAGERVYDVEPLQHDGRTTAPASIVDSDAGALFVDRAQAVRPGLEITPPMEPLVEEICRRLDGLPLAIELAASRLRVLSLPELAERLEDRFRLLAGEDRTAMARHRTLQATVEWSYDHLSSEEQQMFALLGVFRGGFTLAAAEAVGHDVLGPDHDVLDLVTRLVDQSMVMADPPVAGGRSRFDMLDTLREFATRRLEATGGTDAVDQAHSNFFSRRAELADAGLHGKDEAAWLDALDADYANFRRAIARSLGRGSPEDALRILGGLKLYFVARDELMPEARGWIEEVAAADSDPTPALAGALSTGGVLAWSQGDLGAAHHLHRRSLQIAREVGDPARVFRALGDLGLVAVDRGDAEEARELFVEGLAIARRSDDAGDVAIALSNLATVEMPSRQSELIAEALRIHEDTGRQTGIAHLRLMTGWLQLAEGRLAEAGVSFEAAGDLFADLDNQGSRVAALCGLADVALAAGRREVAAVAVATADEVGGAMEWSGIRAIIGTRRAMQRRDADPAHCLQELAEAAAAWEESGLSAGLAEASGLRALLALDLGDVEAAAQWSAQSRAGWSRLRRKRGVAWADGISALVEERRSGPAAALRAHIAALSGYAASGSEPLALDGFLAPGAGGVVARLEALEQAGLCAVRAGRGEAGMRALGVAADERVRTGIVAPQRLREAVDAFWEVTPPPRWRAPQLGFDAAFDHAVEGLAASGGD